LLLRKHTASGNSIKGWWSTALALTCFVLAANNDVVADNAVFLDCPLVVQQGTTDSIALRVFITNDIALNGFTMGYVCHSNGMEFSSVQPGPALFNPNPRGTFTWRVFPATKQVAIGWWNYVPQLP
jgi:hypothetical protein